MSTELQPDIVIAGAGMVGVTLANALAETGRQIVVLEQREGDASQLPAQVRAQQSDGYDSRVSALTCASQQILVALGAWERMQQYRLSPYTDMDVWDGEGTGHIHFDSRELHENCLGHIVENRVTLAALYEVMLTHQNIQLISGVSVTALSEAESGHRIVSLSDGRKLEAPLLVAADGAMSRTRQLASLPMWEWDYGHHALVTTVETELPHRQTAWQRFTEDGPLAFLPLSSADGRHYSSIVWSTSPMHAKQLQSLDDEAFCRALELAFERKLGSVLWSDQRQLFPLRQRHAKYYVKEGFAAIGDAAHTIHPLAGQGVNLGLLDAAALADTLCDAAARMEGWGDLRVLRRFQRSRRSDNLQMSAAMEGFKRLFNQQAPAIRLARNLGMNLLDQLAPVKNHLVMDAMGLRGNLPPLAKRPVAR
ncbi:FAD-dependent monooxygenase [Marinobacterium jannaschii]|uniref:FAD-dependent monooxygenase n=1 Tax=Marinobacterium jannaschii TaxID=64970 RepID=UPI00047F27D3|nr:FAD-dependent monooxygenase [Marinobacterium jannaschii]